MVKLLKKLLKHKMVKNIIEHTRHSSYKKNKNFSMWHYPFQPSWADQATWSLWSNQEVQPLVCQVKHNKTNSGFIIHDLNIIFVEIYHVILMYGL